MNIIRFKSQIGWYVVYGTFNENADISSDWKSTRQNIETKAEAVTSSGRIKFYE
jgi:hypothetical protein